MSARSTASGFSLVELVMVMLLMGILMGIAVPLLRPEKFQLDAGVVLLASTLNAQQRNAVLRQHNIVLAMDTVAGTIRVHYDEDNDGTMDSGEQLTLVQLEDGVVFGRGGTPARPLGGAALSMVEEQASLQALTFRRNGSASEESILYLTSERARLTSGAFTEDTRAVEIERATGRVRCYSYASGAWVQTC